MLRNYPNSDSNHNDNPNPGLKRADGCDSDWFPIGSGVRQGCVVAPDRDLVNQIEIWCP